MVQGYNLKQNEHVVVSFVPSDKCPVVRDYVIRVMNRFEVRDAEGNLVKNLLSK